LLLHKGARSCLSLDYGPEHTQLLTPLLPPTLECLHRN
jgi:hypothetical protein